MPTVPPSDGGNRTQRRSHMHHPGAAHSRQGKKGDGSYIAAAGDGVGQRGDVLREAIGSANLAEFFVTAAVSATFVATVGLSLWPTIAGLVLGGVLAAPFAALAARRLPDRPLMVIVGVVVSLLALRTLVASLRALQGGG